MIGVQGLTQELKTDDFIYIKNVKIESIGDYLYNIN